MASSGRNTNNNSPSQKYAYRDEQDNTPPYTYSSRKYRNTERNSEKSSERGSENTQNRENYSSSRQNHDSSRQTHDSSRQNRDPSKYRDSNTRTRQTRDSDRDSRAGSVRPVTSRHKEHIKQQYQKISEYSTKSIFNDVDLKLVVQLPQGEDKKEWVSSHTLDFYNQVQMMYGTVVDKCTPETCEIMNAGPKVEYYWADGNIVKKPVRLCAQEYCARLFAWIQEQVEDETLFPSKISEPFPKDFHKIATRIFKRLFRVYAHVYHSHHNVIVTQGQEEHLNSSFIHFVLFVTTFELIDKKELQPLQPLIDKLMMTIN